LWTIEHHFTPYTMVTSPLQYLSYIAGIPQQIDLATMVVATQYVVDPILVWLKQKMPE